MEEKLKLKSLSHEELIEINKLVSEFLEYLDNELSNIKELEEARS